MKGHRVVSDRVGALASQHQFTRPGEDSGLPWPIVRLMRSGEYFFPGRALHALYEGGTGAFVGDPGAFQIRAEDGHRGGLVGKNPT
ncbi:jg22338 [Pararge aegeria aegeria]|uniref:Jg22338 protein n=1 Tax=Pararge aegeria aegeria TaxID=348720 RepID=A0A8S4S4J4_9NEOP|nr:jg22338 [Pararge aegeria aegeria]